MGEQAIRHGAGLMPRRVLVAGPPAAGKSTYVRKHAKPGDLVLDYDDIARELGSPHPWDHPERIGRAAEREMRRRIAELPPDRDAWVIRCAPGPEREALAAQIGAEVVVLDVPADEAKRRAVRDGRPAWTRAAIDRWWRNYQPTDHPSRTGYGEQPEMGEQAMADNPVPTPADLAAKTAAPAEPNGNGGTQGEPIKLPEDHPLVRAYNAQKEEIKSLKGNLAAYEQAQMTETERAEARVKAAEERAAQLESANARKDVAIEYGLSADDAALLESLTDVDAMRRLADRLARQAREDAAPRTPKPNPAQRVGDAPAEDKEALARAFFGITN